MIFIKTPQKPAMFGTVVIRYPPGATISENFFSIFNGLAKCSITPWERTTPNVPGENGGQALHFGYDLTGLSHAMGGQRDLFLLPPHPANRNGGPVDEKEQYPHSVCHGSVAGLR